MAQNRADVTLQATAWGVETTKNGKRYLRTSVQPGWYDKQAQEWKHGDYQNYDVWPAPFAQNLQRVLDEIDSWRRQDAIVDVTIVGTISQINAYTSQKSGQAGASLTVNATAICITNVRAKGAAGQQSGVPQPATQSAWSQPRTAGGTDPWGDGGEAEF